MFNRPMYTTAKTSFLIEVLISFKSPADGLTPVWLSSTQPFTLWLQCHFRDRFQLKKILKQDKKHVEQNVFPLWMFYRVLLVFLLFLLHRGAGGPTETSLYYYAAIWHKAVSLWLAAMSLLPSWVMGHILKRGTDSEVNLSHQKYWKSPCEGYFNTKHLKWL